MIVKPCSSCVGRRRSLSAFGAPISSPDEFYLAVLGAGNSFDKMLYVVSEWICYDSSRRYSNVEWVKETIQKLQATPGTEGQLALTTFLGVWATMSTKGVMHSGASCAPSRSSTSLSIDSIVQTGKQVVNYLVESTSGTTPSSVATASSGAASSTVAKASSTNTMLLGLGAVGVLTFLLLGKKKKA